MKVDQILSGGQTGVDRAALHIAYQNMITHGGWCPHGRLAEDGRIPFKYNLQETLSECPSQRTKLNVQDSNGTMIIVPNTPINTNDGTILTVKTAIEQNKPYIIVDLSQKPNLYKLDRFLEDHAIRILNIAGPRESQSPGIYEKSCNFLQHLMDFIEAQPT